MNAQTVHDTAPCNDLQILNTKKGHALGPTSGCTTNGPDSVWSNGEASSGPMYLINSFLHTTYYYSDTSSQC